MIKSLVIILFVILSPVLSRGQNSPEMFCNPIIKGFHPDPSVCIVGDDYYLVTSSFEWYPGLPIYHSRDLMNWKQIGHVLNRPSQLQLKEGLPNSHGLWAPTIRYHNGKFYVVCTAQGAGGNFYVTADNPEGPYSDPVFLNEAQGIDPSLFFDDDGTCWYSGSINETPDEDTYPCEDRIYIQQLDLDKGRLVGEKHILTTGHAVNAPYCEAPHIYKINGKYHLIVAEGGTWENHAVTHFTSDKVTGPYNASIVNPVLTHRHLGPGQDITTIGHADLVQTPDGDWWAVMLGVRPIDGYTMLGRETFLTPVKFHGDVPIFNEGIGRVLMEEKATGLPYTPWKEESVKDEFDSDSLRLCWNFLRTPFNKWYELKDGRLTMQVRPHKVMDKVNPSLIARRIDNFNFVASFEMDFKPAKEEEAGMIVMQNGDNHYRVVMKKVDGKNRICLIKRQHGNEDIVASLPWKKHKAVISLEADGLNYQFRIGDDEKHLIPLGKQQDATVNSSNEAGGFIGPFIGMYASSNGVKSKSTASFEYFNYKPTNL